MAGTANYAGIVKWAQLDLQRIQHRDYVGHLSIWRMLRVWGEGLIRTLILLG